MPKQVAVHCLGYDVYVDWYEGSSDEVMLVLIGLESSKLRAQERVSYICEQTGMSALVLDYSGHGVSPFDLDNVCPAQNFLEVIEAFDWLKAKLPDAKVTVFCTSYGGFMGVQLTKYRSFDRLILRVPAIYPPENFYTKHGDAPTDYVRKVYRTDPSNFENHPLLKRAGNFKGKTLVIRHEMDDICPKPVTDAYVKAFSADYIEQPRFSHSESQTVPSVTEEENRQYLDKIISWLKKGY